MSTILKDCLYECDMNSLSTPFFFFKKKKEVKISSLNIFWEYSKLFYQSIIVKPYNKINIAGSNISDIAGEVVDEADPENLHTTFESTDTVITSAAKADEVDMLRKKCRYRCKEISVLQQQITLLQNELTAIKGKLTGKGSLKDLEALRLKPPPTVISTA